MQSVVADARDHDVGAVGAAEDDVLVTGVAKVVRVRSRRCRIVADDELRQDPAALRIALLQRAVAVKIIELP